MEIFAPPSPSISGMSAKEFTYFITEWTEFPGGRARKNGDFSGEEFREDILRGLVKNYDFLTVDLNGCFVLAPSFLDESFGVLIEEMGVKRFDECIRILLNDDVTAIKELKEIRKTRAALSKQK